MQQLPEVSNSLRLPHSEETWSKASQMAGHDEVSLLVIAGIHLISRSAKSTARP